MLFGSAFGIWVQVFANGVRKLPLLHKPHEHVIAAVTGGVAGASFFQWNQRCASSLSWRHRLATHRRTNDED